MAPTEAVKELYCKDKNFTMMNNTVRKNLSLLLQGTDPNHSVINGPGRNKYNRKALRLQELREAKEW